MQIFFSFSHFCKFSFWELQFHSTAGGNLATTFSKKFKIFTFIPFHCFISIVIKMQTFHLILKCDFQNKIFIWSQKLIGKLNWRWCIITFYGLDSKLLMASPKFATFKNWFFINKLVHLEMHFHLWSQSCKIDLIRTKIACLAHGKVWQGQHGKRRNYKISLWRFP